jgi:predicted anti-sigma-YlaC factor YlaD
MRWKLWSSSRGTKENLEIEGISLFERILKAAPAVIIAILLTFVLSRSGFFRQLETYALDTQVRLQSSQTTTTMPTSSTRRAPSITWR